MTSSSRIRPFGLCWAIALTACGAGSLPGQTDGDGHECPLTEPRGEVTIVAYQSDAWVGLQVESRFQRSTPAREAVSCQRRVAGACAITACQRLGIDFVNGELTCGSTSGGAVLLTRGGVALPRVDGSAQLTLDHALVPGEPFALRTTGGDVAAFATTIDLPQRTTVTGPDASVRGTSLSLATTDTFAVTWAPTTSRVLVIVTANTSDDFTAECAFDGAAGTGTLPVEAVPAGLSNVEVWTEERVDQEVGVFPVAVRTRWTTGTRTWVARGE